MVRIAPVAIIVAGALLALATLEAGLDYFIDPSAAIDSLVRRDFDGFFAEQPLMGSVSLLLRAPAVALVFRENLDVVYFAGVVPCFAIYVAFAAHVLRRMPSGSRDQVLVAVLLLGSLPLVRAIHWGHPEEMLATAFVIGALLAADRRSPLLAGALIGLAFASKQWALLGALPALLVLTERRWSFAISAAAVAGLFTLPMFLGDPDRFLDVLRAAGSIDPQFELGMREGAPGAHVNPQNVFLPFASPAPFQGHELLFVGETVARLAHPAIVLIGLVLPLIVWRNLGRLSLRHALMLLALIFCVRGILDPMSLDYYHLPLVATLATLAAYGGARDLLVALWVTAGLTLAFGEPAAGVDALERHAALKFTLYMATMVPASVWLWRGAMGSPAFARPAANPVPAL